MYLSERIKQITRHDLLLYISRYIKTLMTALYQIMEDRTNDRHS